MKTSRDIAEEHDLALTDRDHYFLALAYRFAGQARAAAELQRIGAESPYFDESRELLREF